MHPEGGGSVEQFENQIHESAHEFSAVCAVLVDDPNDNMMDLGAGTYFAKRGTKTGFVITSAHVVAQKELQYLFLSFSPSFRQDPRRISVQKVHIHNNFIVDAKFSNNDIAIIEFDLTQLREGIEPLPIDAAANYDLGSYHEGSFLGYGPFGTNFTNLLDLARVHRGETWVKVAERSDACCQRPYFEIELPHLSSAEPEAKERHQFSTKIPSFKNITISHLFRFHARQSLPADGDSGGPLLFKTKAGDRYKIAGIVRTTTLATTNLPFGNILMLSKASFEPIFIHRDWINEIVRPAKK